MGKATCLLLSVLIFTTSIQSQNPSSILDDISIEVKSLNEEQRKEYNRIKIKVEPISELKFYQGYNQISKLEFFEIVGYDEEANSIRQLQQKSAEANKSVIKSAGLFWGSMFLMGISVDMEGNTVFFSSLIGACAGTVFLIINQIKFHKINKPIILYPYSTLEEISIEYNKKLIQEIKSK